MTPDDRPAQPSWHDLILSRRGFLAGTAATVSAARCRAGCPPCRMLRKAAPAWHAPQFGHVPATKEPLRKAGSDDVKRCRVCAERRAADEPWPRPWSRTQTGAGRKPSEHQPGPLAGFTFHRAFHRPRHHARHTPLNLQLADPDATVNSGQRVTTSVRFYGRAGERSAPSTTPPILTSCYCGEVYGLADVPLDGNGRAIIGTRATTRT